MSEINNELGEYLRDAENTVEGFGERINKELGETISKIKEEASRGVSEITKDAIASERYYERETDRIQNAKRKWDTRYLAGLRENVEKIKELRDEELKCLELSYEMGVIGTADYFNQLESFRDRYFEKGSVEWLEFTAKILEHNKDLMDEQEKALLKACESTAEGIKAQYAEIEKEQEKLEDKLSSFGGIAAHNTIEMGKGEADLSYMSLGNIGAQNKLLEEYLRLMSQAQAKINKFWSTDTGDSAKDEKNMLLRNSYFAQLRDMSVTDATDFARVITAVGEEELIKHLGEYERRQELSDSISKTLFSSEVSDTAALAGKNLGEDFADALYDELSKLSGKFFTNGEEACKSFGEGFMSNLSAVLRELNAQVSVGVKELGFGTNTTNNTSYNIYGNGNAEDTLRLLREKEEMKKMLLG